MLHGSYAPVHYENVYLKVAIEP